ncbi:MAG: hypothetical protein ACHQ4H_12615 [Ktedonobacterales bacterium]
MKGFFYQVPPVQQWADFPGLRVYTVAAAYAFALKAIAGRPEDIGDLRALAASMGVSSAEEALEIVARYIPQRLVLPRTQCLIETLFDADDEEDG